ncbi:MAG: metallophosphoesterase [Bacteroidales bacterium]|nr:metallophosphoesterase [Bacteroidales bacterium]
MKNYGFVIFFSIVLIIYSLLNYYIIRRGLSLTGDNTVLRMIIIWGVVLLSSSFIAGRFAERITINGFTTTFIWIGSFWLGIMVYLVFQLALVDLLKGINKFIPYFPDFIVNNPVKTRMITAVVIVFSTILITIVGHVNTWFPAVTKLDIGVNKKAGVLKELHIVAFSDVHLGTIIEKRHLKGIVKRVNALSPDIILIPGDIIDEDIAPVIHNNVGEILTQLSAKYGVYAVTGNHEYIGGVDKAKKYLKDHQINLLNDSVVLIDSSFYIAGREDISIKQFKGQKRKDLPEILKGIDTSLPLILLDHQPFNLSEAQSAGVDLQLSGHTHNGQIWPLNYITDWIFEKGAGYFQKGLTHYYISSGIGGWGPPIRTNGRPEIIQIKMKFNN